MGCGVAPLTPTPTTVSAASSGPSAPSAPSAPGATATRAPIATLDAASIDLHVLDASFVPADAPVSTGAEILWAAGTPWPSEIWRYRPGAAQPERIFSSPRSKSTITSVVGSGSGYAFAETSEPAFGEGGWRVWYVAGPGAAPVQLDAGNAIHARQTPTLAMDDERVGWAAFDEPRDATGDPLDVAVSRLRVANVGDLRHVTTLLDRPVRESLLFYPALHGDELWYGTIFADFEATGVGDEYHIEVLDLHKPTAPPLRFAGTGNDFNPAANDRNVVWKTNVAGDSALNWGTLHVLDRESDAVAVIPVEHADLPSTGDRFIAFDEITHTRLLVYDPITRSVVDLGLSVADDAAGKVFFGGASLRGDILAFSVQAATTGTEPRVGWARLPE
jgi:hypothetical protein